MYIVVYDREDQRFLVYNSISFGSSFWEYDLDIPLSNIKYDCGFTGQLSKYDIENRFSEEEFCVFEVEDGSKSFRELFPEYFI